MLKCLGRAVRRVRQRVGCPWAPADRAPSSLGSHSLLVPRGQLCSITNNCRFTPNIHGPSAPRLSLAHCELSINTCEMKKKRPHGPSSVSHWAVPSELECRRLRPRMPSESPSQLFLLHGGFSASIYMPFIKIQRASAIQEFHGTLTTS